MPLFTRTIQPVAVSRVEVNPSIPNELECVTNNSLSNIIRQLSGLSKYAEDMFMELSQEASNVLTRSSSLQHRIDNLRDKVTQLNATVEEVSLQDIHLRKPFKSSISKEQQVISRNTVPRAILESYTHCTQPPALDKLNQFREDGKDSMKFYTDPGYFFELWVAEMEKDFKDKKEYLHKKRQRRRPREQTKQKSLKQIPTMKDKWEAQKFGEELSNYQVPDTKKHVDTQKIPSSMVQVNNNNTNSQTHRPDSINLKKQNSVIRTDSQKHQHQHTEKHDTTSNKPIQNGPAHIPYPNQTDNHVNQIANHTSYDPRANNNSSPQHRPSERPPAPPVSGKDSPSGGRDILPPPPPPPPAEHFIQNKTSSPYPPAPHHQIDSRASGSPHHMIHSNSTRNSPAKHPFTTQHISMDQSIDLPPPPLSPKDNTPDTPISMDSMPPPPSPPLPYDQVIGHFAKAPSPPPPPPPPPPPLDQGLPNGLLKTSQLDEASISSSGSTVTNVSTSLGKAETDRSALLNEIRIGTRLKKLNRLEEKEEKKKMPSGRLDVQAIMDKAFEMRRRVIEDSESEEENDSEENEW